MTMIEGIHFILYAHDADRAKAFFRDVLQLDSVDAGHGWLIFALPPAELAAHPTDAPETSAEQPRCEAYLMCRDLDATMAELAGRGVEFTGPVSEQRWGRLVSLRVPGAGPIGLYQPKHPTAVALE